jgi:hypothetical protein
MFMLTLLMTTLRTVKVFTKNQPQVLGDSQPSIMKVTYFIGYVSTFLSRKFGSRHFTSRQFGSQYFDRRQCGGRQKNLALSFCRILVIPPDRPRSASTPSARPRGGPVRRSFRTTEADSFRTCKRKGQTAVY